MYGFKHIHDNNLAEAITRSGASDVSEIQELNVRDMGISSLKGIEQLRNLRLYRVDTVLGGIGVPYPYLKN